MNRREFIRTAIATTTLLAVAATGAFELGAKEGANRASAQQSQLRLPPVTTQSSQASTQTSQGAAGSTTSAQAASTAAAPAGYVLVAQISDLAGQSSAYFTHPTHGNSILLDLNGQWRAFSVTCTHRPCTVEFQSSELYCPCHGATFNATNGSVTRGPAQVALGEFGVVEQNGGVYVSDSVVN